MAGKKAEERRPVRLAFALMEDDYGRFLLGLRPESKSHEGGLWALPGGRIESRDPNPEYAAKRETKEETGYDVEIGKLILHYACPETERWVYEAVVTGGDLMCQEFDDLNWFYLHDIEKFPQGLTEMTNRAISLYLKER